MTNLFDLTGKVAIVIAGSRRLGRGMATGLLNAGAKVYDMIILSIFRDTLAGGVYRA